MDSPTTGKRTSLWPPAFLLLLALLQLALAPLVQGGDIEIAPLFRVDSLGILFGIAWTLTLAALSVPLTGQRVAGFPVIIGLGFLVSAYAHNAIMLALGGAIAGLGIWVAQNQLHVPAKISRAALIASVLAIALVAVPVFMSFPAFTPPAGGVTGPWHPAVVLAVAAILMLGHGVRTWRGWRRGADRAEPEAGAAYTDLYALATPYILAKMLVAAPWHPLGSWLLVLVGMLVLLVSAYTAYSSEEQRRAWAFVSSLVGISLAGFGLASSSPPAAAGATWAMLAGLLWVAARGWRWAEIATLLAVLPGLWMVSQAALDTGYGVVAVLLLPAYILLASLTLLSTSRPQRAWHWTGFVPVALSVLATALPQLIVEALVRPAVRTMAGGVAALTTLAIDWGVGMLVRSPQGTVQAALPATGGGLAVFLAAVALYWVKQLAGRAERRLRGDTQPE
jgi:hypothetical protein